MSKTRYSEIEQVCACGCGQTFFPSIDYYTRAEGGGIKLAKYKRGHNPATTQGIKMRGPWNKGLKKGDHPSLERMGFQKGHPLYADGWSVFQEKLRTDPEFKARWLKNKSGWVSPRKGTGKDNTTCRLRQLKKVVYERDAYTCQNCGKVESNTFRRRRLNMHHIVPKNVDPSLTFELSNLITLCTYCHKNAHMGNLPHLIKTDIQADD